MKLSGEVSPEFDGELIHKMRTTVKKMRALADWSGIPSANFFRKYYKAAGRIREVQLLLIKIRKGECKVTSSFNEWLQSRLHQLKVEWQDMYDEGKMKEQLRKLKTSLGGAKQKEHSIRFETEKNEKIISFKNERPLSDEQIHNGRKTIKEIDFLNKWEKKNLDEALKRISDESGDYMDRCSELKLLELYIEQEKDESKRNEAITLRTRWENYKEAEKIKLMNSIDSLPG